MQQRKSSLSFWQRQTMSLVRHGGVPKHVAFIMDGNRRFAREKGLGNVVEGHSLGFESLLNCLEWCLEIGIEIVTVYAFSQENFARPKPEVDALMKLAEEKFVEFLSKEGLVMEKRIRVRMWGRKELLPEQVRLAAANVVIKTAQNDGPRLNVCFSYSGIDEMVIASQRISHGITCGLLDPSQDVNSTLLTRLSYLGTDSPPDLVVRTSGETRLSDFLIMHLEHAVVAYVDELWPDISLWTILAIILDWQYRRRRQEDVPSSSSLTLKAEAYAMKCEHEDMESWHAMLLPQ